MKVETAESNAISALVEFEAVPASKRVKGSGEIFKLLMT
jgi:hypothetical protein